MGSKRRWPEYLFPYTVDLICLLGIIFFEWDGLKMILYYWLNTCVMVVFVALFLKKMNNLPWDISMFSAIAFMLFVLYLYYCGIIIMAVELGYPVTRDQPFMFALQPYYQIPVFAVLMVVDQFKEYKFFTGLLHTDPDQAGKYYKIFTFRTFLILGICFIGISLGKNHQAIMLISFVFLKSILETFLRRK